jgi:hypothetical protein
MVTWIARLVRSMTREDVGVALFGLSFFIGVWYALPMVNTITDVWAFGGGVLRAMEAHTLLPGGDLSYGTLSFYQNYLFMAVALVFGFVFSGFDLVALKTILVLNPSYSLLVPRMASALTATVLLFFVYRFLKTHVESVLWRSALLILIFGNVLTAILVRSGKMWILSIGLVVISFIYLYRAIAEEKKFGVPGKFAAISVITAFLATANFPIAGVFLINVPILLYVFPRTREAFRRLSLFAFAGGAVFLVIFALNAANIVEQVSGFVTQFLSSSAKSVIAEKALTPFEAFMVNARHAIEAFPLLLIALIPALRSGIRDKTLAYLALLYIAIYIVAVAIIFRTDHGLALNVRHIFPIGFFLLFLLAAFKPPAKWVSAVFFSAGLLIYVYILVLLSIPTTYNAVSDFIEREYGGASVRIDEHIWELTLPMNKASYELFADPSCGSTCQHVRALPEDIAFRPVVVTSDSDPAAVAELPPPDLIVTERVVDDCTPLARFGNDISDTEVFDVDINLGRMLMPSFYRLHHLGKNIYVYDAKECVGTSSMMSSNSMILSQRHE